MKTRLCSGKYYLIFGFFSSFIRVLQGYLTRGINSLKLYIIGSQIVPLCLTGGALRLGTSDSFSSGRLEVYFNGEWGTVCNDLFFQTEANVACRQLGYSSATNYGTATSLG